MPYPTLTQTEMKILIYRKIKVKGMTYDEARAELTGELAYFKEQYKKKKIEAANKKVDIDKSFKEQFKELKKKNEKTNKK